MSDRNRLATVLLQALKDHGAAELFGIPGDFALPLFKAIQDSDILPMHTLSHEPAVGFAADAAARIGNGLGVAVVTYGAGALNMVNSVTCAWAEKSPLVVISGAPGIHESRGELLLHHQGKHLGTQFEIYREITCDQAVLDRPERAHEDIARVLHNCTTQSRPVYIEIPRDLVQAPCSPVQPLEPEPPEPAALKACAQEILQRLQQARAPVLLAGVEIRRYGLEEKAARLARRLGLPMATSFMGRGMFSGMDCPLLGCYLGVAGDPRVRAAVEQSDQLLMLGVIVCDTNFGVSSASLDLKQAIQVVDGQVRMGYHLYPHQPLEALLDTLLELAEPLRLERRPEPEPTPLRDLPLDDAPIQPEDIARAVNDLFHRHGPMPMAADVGDCLFTALEMENTHLVAPGYYATMGFGVPAGLGLQARSGKRPIILVGDGAFQMTGWELGNCRRNGWDPIVLLFNNRCWGMLDCFQPEGAWNRLDDWHFADMARALGGDGVRVQTRAELADALERAVATRGRFQLVEIMIPRDTYSPILRQFVALKGLGQGKRG